MGRNRKQLCTNFPLILVATLWEKPRGKVNVWDILLTMKSSTINFAYFCLAFENMLNCVFSMRQRVSSNNKSLMQGVFSPIQSLMEVVLSPHSSHFHSPWFLVFCSAFITSWHHCCCPCDWGRKDKIMPFQGTVQTFSRQPRVLGALLERLHWVSCDGPIDSLSDTLPGWSGAKENGPTVPHLDQFILWDWGWVPFRSVC